MLNGKFHLYARYASGYQIKIRYVPDSGCDHEYIYCFIKGKYSMAVKVSEMEIDPTPEVTDA